MYAYILSHHLKNKTKVRILSLGTGTKHLGLEDQDETINKFDKFSSLTMLNDFMMNIETSTAEYMLDSVLFDDHLRLQVQSQAEMDQYDEKSLEVMKTDGEKMFNRPETSEKMKVMLKSMVD